MNNEATIKRLANSIARKKGFGKATQILFGNVQKPRVLDGENWFYTNRTGQVIHYPSAYAKKGFSSMVYHTAWCEVVLPYSVVDWRE
jgi:hypothetical protein